MWFHLWVIGFALSCNMPKKAETKHAPAPMPSSQNALSFKGIEFLPGYRKQGKVIPAFTTPDEDILLKALADLGAEQGYILISSGGWSNVGKSLIYRKPKAQLFHKIVYDVNGKKKADVLDQAQSDFFQSNIEKYQILEHYLPDVFDGLQFEFLAVKVSKKNLDITSRVSMNNPGVIAQDKAKVISHLALIQLMGLKIQ